MTARTSHSSNSSSGPQSDIQFSILATDIACFRVVNGVLEVLLGKTRPTSSFPDRWALIGGLIRPDETADQSVERHITHKGGLRVAHKEQLYTFSKLNRDPRGRVISVAYIACVQTDAQPAKETELPTLWRPISEVSKLAYDHDEILAAAVERLSGKLAYTTIARFLVPNEFTLSELQKVYEAVLGKGLDKRNFRKKLISEDIVRDTKLTRKEGVMRPAALYRFTSNKLEMLGGL